MPEETPRAKAIALGVSLFDIDPDPLTGERREANGGGFDSEREA